jgi:hypothetical protein
MSCTTALPTFPLPSVEGDYSDMEVFDLFGVADTPLQEEMIQMIVEFFNTNGMVIFRAISEEQCMSLTAEQWNEVVLKQPLKKE